MISNDHERLRVPRHADGGVAVYELSEDAILAG